jgi:Molybdopterin biosynthesis enzyme
MNPIQPPPLKNDCFALPPGVDWTPVEEAKARLRSALSSVVAADQKVPIEHARDRILAADISAARSNPPASTQT